MTPSSIPETFAPADAEAVEQADGAADAGGWHPFVTPAPIWDAWWTLLIPLLIGIAVIYKATKSPSARKLPWEAARLAAYMLGFLVLAAVVLLVVVEWWL